jgi:hypothetical protein
VVNLPIIVDAKEPDTLDKKNVLKNGVNTPSKDSEDILKEKKHPCS